jgi:alpha-galactosidase
MRRLTIAFFLLLSLGGTAQKFEGLALTPPMGWNSWNTFQTNISEQLVRGIADVMVTSGMRDAGYTYLVLDDGWMAMERDRVTGDLVPDPVKFPHGMRAVVDYVHSKGLKFGLYNCAGTKTCAGYPGTRGYEYQDARLYASLQIDYLKFDWCNTDGINAKEAYATMSKALRAAGRPVIFSLCEWGQNKPWEWAASVGHLWRTTGDISAVFDGVVDHGTWKSQGVMQILDGQGGLRKFAGPGHWNDSDMLEVGVGSLTPNENRAHFSMWAMLAAPLIAGNDLRAMTAATREVLTNKEVIAVNQDALGIQGFKYEVKDSVETWVKPLQGGDWALCFLNRSSSARSFSFDWQQATITDSISNAVFHPATTLYTIKELWHKKEAGDTRKPVTITIPSRDIWMVRLQKQ